MNISAREKSHSVIEVNIIENNCKQEGNGEAGETREAGSKKTEKESRRRMQEVGVRREGRQKGRK